MQRKHNYYKLNNNGDDIKRRNFELETKIPWGSIFLAFFLTILGAASFVLAWLHFTQRFLGKEQAEIGFTILGFVTFVPGFYQLWIALGAYKGWRGFTYDLIPSY
mmetsp:Transcript_853/g.1154  ORF Transcript_853/g.1154 Transcript_853/m.1154 type:complete len:105 (+) Transcript_853:207-521(+)